MDRKFDIGGVFSRVGTILSKNLILYVVLTLTIGLLLALATTYTGREYFAGADAGVAAFAALGSGLFGGILMAGYMAFITAVAFQAEEGGTFAVAPALRRGLVTAIPLIIHYLLFSVAFMLGLVLLFVPGLILMCMWAVTLPSLVGERTGIIGSFGRSRALTKGSRWSIFGLIVILFIMTSVVGGLLALVPVLSGGGIVGFLLLLPETLYLAVYYFFYAIFQAAMFFELREAKEGTSSDYLSEVFA